MFSRFTVFYRRYLRGGANGDCSTMRVRGSLALRSSIVSTLSISDIDSRRARGGFLVVIVRDVCFRKTMQMSPGSSGPSEGPL